MKIPELKEIINFVKINIAAIVVLGFALVLFLGLFQIISLPKIKKFMDLRKQVSIYVSSKETLESVKNNKIILGKELQDLEKRYFSNEKMFVMDSQEESFLSDLSKLARTTNVKLISIQPLLKIQRNIPSSKDTYFELPYKIGIGCGYHELGRFLNQLENMRGRSLRMNRLEVRAGNQDIWEHDIELEISIFAKNL